MRFEFTFAAHPRALRHVAANAAKAARSNSGADSKTSSGDRKPDVIVSKQLAAPHAICALQVTKHSVTLLASFPMRHIQVLLSKLAL